LSREEIEKLNKASLAGLNSRERNLIEEGIKAYDDAVRRNNIINGNKVDLEARQQTRH
jgi:hypothetical protein